jgi:hypothetical protein
MAREPEYSTADIDALIASRRAEREPRNSYGVPLSEATSEDADPARWERKYGYEAHAQRDYAADVVETARTEYREKYPDANHGALIWTVRRFDL